MKMKHFETLIIVFALLAVVGCKEGKDQTPTMPPVATEESKMEKEPEKAPEIAPVKEEKPAEEPKEAEPPPPPKIWTAAESNPKNFGWMQGFPPPEDRILSASDRSFFKFPALRYSVCHMRQFFPTTDVPSAQENRYTFESYPDPNIDALTFTPTGSTETMTWEDSLAANFTDGIIILHKGKIIYEKYFGALTQEGIHALMSVTKTFTGTLASILVANGELDDTKLVKEYIPQLANSGLGDATVRDVLDMKTAIKYSEDYSDPKAEVWTYTAAGDPFPKPADYKGPRNYYEALEGIQKDGTHGEVFSYRTPNADLAGWLISTVTDKPLAEVLDHYIWHPIGADHAAYYQIDSSGIAFAGGGLNANLRDVAKFGQMILDNGRFNGKQVIPAAVVQDIRTKGDKEAFAKSEYTSLKGWSYRDMWWKTNNADGAFMARGVHGQAIYIDPKAEMVIVRVASHPKAANAANDPTSLPAYQAVADYLISKNPLAPPAASGNAENAPDKNDEPVNDDSDTTAKSGDEGDSGSVEPGGTAPTPPAPSAEPPVKPSSPPTADPTTPTVPNNPPAQPTPTGGGTPTNDQ